jgi:hypothetical protein
VLPMIGPFPANTIVGDRRGLVERDAHRWAMVCTMRQDPGAMPEVSSARAWQKRRASAAASGFFATTLFKLGSRCREAVFIRHST